MTLGTYGHVLPAARQETADLMDAVLMADNGSS